MAALVASCSGASPSPTPLTTPHTSTISSSDDLDPTIEDFSGLLIDARMTAIDARLRFEVVDIAVVNPVGNPSAIDVVWVMSQCERRPVIQLRRVAEEMEVRVYRGPSEPPDCEAMGLVRAVRLQLSQPWPVEAVQARVLDGEPPRL